MEDIDYKQSNNRLRAGIVVGIITLGLVVVGTRIFEQQYKEKQHNQLPAIFQPYDTSPRDGVLQMGELEKFAQDHPELQNKH